MANISEIKASIRSILLCLGRSKLKALKNDEISLNFNENHQIFKIHKKINHFLISLYLAATDQEFRKAYYEIEGTNFNEVLKKLNINFYD
jgi:hypothetical protein